MTDVKWKKAADCVGSNVDGALVLLDIDGGKYFALNGPAADVWEALDEPITASGLVDYLVGKYTVAPEECAASVEKLLDDLASKGLAKPAA